MSEEGVGVCEWLFAWVKLLYLIQYINFTQAKKVWPVIRVTLHVIALCFCSPRDDNRGFPESLERKKGKNPCADWNLAEGATCDSPPGSRLLFQNPVIRGHVSDRVITVLPNREGGVTHWSCFFPSFPTRLISSFISFFIWLVFFFHLYMGDELEWGKYINKWKSHVVPVAVSWFSQMYLAKFTWTSQEK